MRSRVGSSEAATTEATARSRGRSSPSLRDDGILDEGGYLVVDPSAVFDSDGNSSSSPSSAAFVEFRDTFARTRLSVTSASVGGLDSLTISSNGTTTGILDPVGRYTLRNAFGFGRLVLALDLAAEIRPAAADDDDDGNFFARGDPRDILDRNRHAGRASLPLPLRRREQRHPVRHTARFDRSRRERMELPPDDRRRRRNRRTRRRGGRGLPSCAASTIPTGGRGISSRPWPTRCSRCMGGSCPTPCRASSRHR